MSSPLQNKAICRTCGARIETIGSGDLGCLACFLRAGLDGAPDAADSRLDEVAEVLGTYRIERREDGSPWELGHGAMGVTYRAQDISLRREVALKLINADFAQHGSDARGRFLREARAAASLRHPNLAAVHQFGIDEETGRCFFAMELIEGETLDERVRRSGPLPVPIVREIARQIAEALVVAEKHGVVHRDLKPGNVMIAESDQPDRVAIKIIDFGLAKALGETEDPRVLTDGGFLGTPAFASPEQLARSPVDVRSDIYSLGAMLWYLLTGQLPFGDRPPARPPVAQLKAAHVPASFISILLAMLATEPAARPSAKEIVTRLQGPPRHRAWTAVAVIALVIGALAVVYFFSCGRRRRPSRRSRPRVWPCCPLRT